MSLSSVKLPSLTIPNGSNVSNVLSGPGAYDDAESIMLFAPSALDALTYTIEVNSEPDGSGDWVTLVVGDPVGDAAPPVAGKARAFYELSTAPAFRIKASGNVGSDHTWNASKSTYSG